MTRPVAILLALIALALPLSLLAGRVWVDPWSTPNAAAILAEPPSGGRGDDGDQGR